MDKPAPQRVRIYSRNKFFLGEFNIRFSRPLVLGAAVLIHFDVIGGSLKNATGTVFDMAPCAGIVLDDPIGQELTDIAEQRRAAANEDNVFDHVRDIVEKDRYGKPSN